ncbi:MAG: 3'-5' exonuclease [Thermoleophilaceae bacterium]
MSDAARPDLYISADVETDGPVPGVYSLLSFGMYVVGAFDGERLRRPQAPLTLYRELRPISEDFQPEALEINGLDRDQLVAEGADPVAAMDEAATWVAEVADGHRPVLVAYPVAFDWSFLYWYFERFCRTGSPFGHSSCLDIRTLYQAQAGTVFDLSGKRNMPAELLPEAPHTHNALDDAIEQGELFANLFSWTLRRRDSAAALGPSAPSWMARRLVPLA